MRLKAAGNNLQSCKVDETSTIFNTSVLQHSSCQKNKQTNTFWTDMTTTIINKHLQEVTWSVEAKDAGTCSTSHCWVLLSQKSTWCVVKRAIAPPPHIPLLPISLVSLCPLQAPADWGGDTLQPLDSRVTALYIVTLIFTPLPPLPSSYEERWQEPKGTW